MDKIIEIIIIRYHSHKLLFYCSIIKNRLWPVGMFIVHED